MGEGEYGGGRVWGRESMGEGEEDGQEEGEGERSLKKFSSGKCLGTSEGVKLNMDQSNNYKNQKPSVT